MRRNSAYCAGVLSAELTPQFAAAHYGKILTALRPLFEKRPKENAAIVDNACSAVGRMICAAPNALPLAEVLPVMLAVMPLKEDIMENEPAYKPLLQLWAARNAAFMAIIPLVLSVCSRALMAPAEKLQAEVRAPVAQMCREICQEAQKAGKLAGLLGPLAPQEQQALQAAMQQR